MLEERDVIDAVLLEGCHVGVLRALEYIGKRMVFGSRKHRPDLRDIQQAHPFQVHLFIPLGDRDLDHLMDGAWTCLAAARDDAHLLVPVLDRYVRLLLIHQNDHSRDHLRRTLVQAGLHRETVDA